MTENTHAINLTLQWFHFTPIDFFFFYHRTLTSLANFNFLYSSCRCEKVGFAVTLQHHHSALSICSLAYYRTEGCAMIITRHIEEGSFRLCGSGLWLKGKIKSLFFSIFFLHFSFDPDPELDCSHPVEGNHLWTSILVLLSLRWVKTLCGPLGHTTILGSEMKVRNKILSWFACYHYQNTVCGVWTLHIDFKLCFSGGFCPRKLERSLISQEHFH